MEYQETYDINKIKFLNTIDENKYIEFFVSKNSTKSKKDIKSSYTNLKNFTKNLIKGKGKSSCQITNIYTQKNSRGRYYSNTPSIQGLSRRVRDFLCRGLYTDIDIVNCYPTILKYICEKNKIICPQLSYYVEHRDEVFAKYPSDTEFIKEQIFKIIFGGRNLSKNEFVVDFNTEFKKIQKRLLEVEDYKKYIQELSSDKTNKEGCACFKIIEDIEIQVIQKLLVLLESKDIKVLAYMYDGCMIYGDSYKDENLLDEIQQFIDLEFKELGIKFKYKTFEVHEAIENYYKNFDVQDYTFATEIEKGKSYEEMKEVFEGYCAKIVDKALFIVEKFNGERLTNVVQFTESKLNTSYKHLVYLEIIKDKVVEKPFLFKWLHDPNIRLYEDIDIYPPGIRVPKGVYNMWVDFEMEFVDNYVPKITEMNRLLDHIKIICGNDDDIYKYFIKWIAYLIQFPSKKTICPVFVSKEGAGKGTVVEMIRRMLGSKKVMECTNPERDVWGDFNGEMVSSYLVEINELGKKQQTDSVGKIKGLITDYELIINQKGLPQTKVISYHKFMITTNKEDPVYTDDNDRRFFLIRSSDEKIKDLKYFNELRRLIEDDNVIKTLYEFFKCQEDIEEFPSLVKPTSEYHENIKELNRPVELLFLEYLCEIHNTETVDYTSNDLYKEFVKYTNDNGIHYETNTNKLMCTFRNLKFKGIEKKKNNKGTRLTILNINKLKKDLNIDYFD